MPRSWYHRFWESGMFFPHKKMGGGEGHMFNPI